MQNILLTLCARSGSKGVKNKNIRLLDGIPLIAHSIKQAHTWGKATNIIVSTDSIDIQTISKKYGAEIPFTRPAYLATDNVGKIEVLRHALIESEKHYSYQFQTIIDLDVTSPIRNSSDIDNAFIIFMETKADAVFSVTKARKNPYFNMVEESIDGKITICKKGLKKFLRRQDSPPVYEMNASIYIYTRSFLLNPVNKTPIAKNSKIYVMDELSSIDIDTELDFKIIEFLVKEGLYKL